MIERWQGKVGTKLWFSTGGWMTGICGCCVLLLTFLSTCDRAPNAARYLPPKVGRSVGYPGYYELNGETVTLMGAVIGGKASATEVRDLIAALKRHGGNYLCVPGHHYLRTEMQDFFRMANRRGMLLDTGQYAFDVPTVGSLEAFHNTLLAGAGGAVFAEITQRRLNAIRAARTVEQHVDFWHLRAAPGLVASDGGTGWTESGSSVYVLYTPKLGRAAVLLPDGGQERRRVSVIGPLGTQRSEVLDPPYDRRFELVSNEERGGYMVIAPAN